MDRADCFCTQKFGCNNSLLRVKHTGDTFVGISSDILPRSVNGHKSHVKGPIYSSEIPPVTMPQRVAAMNNPLAATLDYPGYLWYPKTIYGRHRPYHDVIVASCEDDRLVHIDALGT